MNEYSKKIIVAHPGKQHSFELAYAIKQSNSLYKYITTVYDKKKSLTSYAKIFLKGSLKKKANTRACDYLSDEEVVQFNELMGLFLIFLSKFPLNRKYTDFLNKKISDSFGKKVAKYAIKHNVDAVICFDSNCTVLFNILKKRAPHIKRIMDVSIASRIYMKEQYIKDMNLTGDNGFLIEQSFLWKEKNMIRFKKEIDDTEYFLAPSQIVKKSLEFSGVRKNKIFIVPYGVDNKKFNYCLKKKIDTPLRLIYVGQISYRKGIHHLLKVISMYNKDEIILDLAGGYSINSPIYKKYKDTENINFLGFVTRDVLNIAYQQSNVFVFPTLGEGFGLVVLEAMSSGIPVISTDHAGGNDAITEGIDGFIYPAGDDEKLKKILDYCIENPEKILKMGVNARKKSESYTWEIYYKNISNVLFEIFSK